MISLSVRQISIAIAIGCCVITPFDAFAVPQDAILVAKTGAADEAQSKPPEQYLITVSQYRLKDVDASAMTADNIATVIKTEKVVPVETVMLSAIAGLESRVSFGRSETVTTGRVADRRGGNVGRRTVARDLGTILEVTPTTEGQQVGLTLDFSSSGHSGEGTDDSPPDVTATTINITRLFDLGKPTLIGATTAGETSYVFLTVSRQ